MILQFLNHIIKTKYKITEESHAKMLEEIEARKKAVLEN